MRKALALLLLPAFFLLTGRGAFLSAQENPPAYDETVPDDEEEDEEDAMPGPDFNLYVPDMYSKGDQTVTISLGAAFPTVFLNNGNVIDHHIEPPVGGVLSLAYSHFLGAHLFLGGEVGFLTAFTLAKNALFIIPVGLRAGWQFIYRRFEFPLYATIGIAPQRYLNFGYFGMFVKGTVSGYYRFNPNWSFGLSADWSWYPQWPMENGQRVPRKDMDANIVGVSLSARYHF